MVELKKLSEKKYGSLNISPTHRGLSIVYKF